MVMGLYACHRRGCFRSNDISGMPVKAHVRLSGIGDKYQAKSVVQSKNKSDKACYALLGTITYTDPLGYEHQENINLCSIRLMAE